MLQNGKKSASNAQHSEKNSICCNDVQNEQDHEWGSQEQTSKKHTYHSLIDFSNDQGDRQRINFSIINCAKKMYVYDDTIKS